jgi:ABC-type dipeptide/oligopeptide/nickel transport system permease subunit
VLAFFLVGALAGVLAPYPAGETFLEFVTRPQPPLTHGHLLGTDYLGRDLLTQLLFAIRQSAELALICAVGATIIGVVVGLLSGYYGGVLDGVFTWLTSAVVTVPTIGVLLIVVVYEWPVSPVGFGFALMLLLWTAVARAVRASVATLRAREFVEAAHAAGGSDLHVLMRHLLPNAIGSVIVASSALIGQSIVVVATATFFGYGTVQAEKPTLGSLIASAVPGPGTPWWLGDIPIAVLVVFVVCVSVVGDALDDALNPRRHRR